MHETEPRAVQSYISVDGGQLPHFGSSGSSSALLFLVSLNEAMAMVRCHVVLTKFMCFHFLGFQHAKLHSSNSGNPEP